MKVDELKVLNFSQLSLEEKIKIKEQGRPLPLMKITQISKSKSRDFKREFNKNTYDKHDWICGCEVTNRFYCFPCLLFAKIGGETAWIHQGVCDLNHLSEKIKKHIGSQSHMNSVLELSILGKVDIRQQLDSAYRQNIRKFNEEVSKNRYVLSKIIDCVRFCGAFELALRGHDETKDSDNPGIFKGLINFTAELDGAMKEHLDSATVFKGTSADIQNDLLDCILTVCQDHIMTEISESKFAAVIADETTDISSIFQLVIVFRYILPDGQPVERFWEFTIPEGHDAESLSTSIKATLGKVINDPTKLISQSYDGANVMSGQHGGVQTLVRAVYENAHFVHCYAHQLNLIVAQSASQNQEVRIFFCNLSDITNFFSNSPQRVAILDEVVGQRVPRASSTRWNFKSRTVNTVFENREALIECMERIEQVSKQTTAINQATAIRRMLNDSKFIFWLTVFHSLMPHVDILFNQLQKRSSNASIIRKSIDAFKCAIQQERDQMDKLTQAQKNRVMQHQTINAPGSLKIHISIDRWQLRRSAM